MKRQRAEISSNVISHIKSAHPIEMWRSNKLGIKEKINRGNFPRLIFSCPVPSGLPHRSHCVPMNMNPCGYRLFRWSEWRDLNSRPLDPQSSALPTALHPDIFISVDRLARAASNCKSFFIFSFTLGKES